MKPGFASLIILNTTGKREWSVCTMAIFLLMGPFALIAQRLTYDNFEGKKYIHYSERTGVLDSLVNNPKTDSVNKSQKCAYYVRNASKKFDNIKMQLPSMLSDVGLYATYLGIPPKFKMKIYTTAPAGTLVEILLGNRNGNNDYPAGTNSQYQARTTRSHQWEELEFLFSQIPEGSETPLTQINQVTLLFNPNSSTSDTYYFDDLTGPPLNINTTGTPAPLTEKQDNIIKTQNTKSSTTKKTNKK